MADVAARYGIALAALGMLATLSCGLTIDGFGPISDNAGGIADTFTGQRDGRNMKKLMLEASGKPQSYRVFFYINHFQNPR